MGVIISVCMLCKKHYKKVKDNTKEGTHYSHGYCPKCWKTRREEIEKQWS